MTEGYTKLDNNIITSSVWSETSDTRVVWITLLTLSGFDGKVKSSIPGLARIANVSLEACEKALDIFLKPDSYSRNKKHKGCRLKEMEGGWEILNRGLYQQKSYSRAKYYQDWRAQQRNSCATGLKQCETHEDEYEDKDEYEKINKKEIHKEKFLLIFDIARKLYPGTKRGLEVEYKNFTKKHPEYLKILPLLEPAIRQQIEHREKCLSVGSFVRWW